MKQDTKKIALCGVLGALALGLMMTGGLIPLAVYVAPALAGLLILPVACEAGSKTGWMFYVGVSLLSAFLVADKELSAMFLFLLGYYPLLKGKLDTISSRLLRFLAKFMLFNVAISAAYACLIFVMGLASVRTEFAGFSVGLWIALIVLGNFTFFAYDLVIERFFRFYKAQIRPRLLKDSHHKS